MKHHNNDSISRRTFLQKSTVAASMSRTLGLLGGAGLMTSSGTAVAKPGGHRSVVRECRSTFAIDYKGVKDEVTLYLAGTGYASFDNVYDYSNFNVLDAIFSPTVSMKWEVDICYAGNRPDLGLVRCTTLVKDKSDSHSSLILIGGDPEKGLFPATMINTLYVEIELPNLGVTMVNKDPMLFRGETINLDAEIIKSDPRVLKDPRGVPTLAKEIMSAESKPDFNPIGFHALQRKNVEFYNKENHDERVAVLLDAEIQTLMNYGVQVSLNSASIDRNVVTVEWGIDNLLWDSTLQKPLDLVWYVEDSHELEILGNKEGRVTLEDKQFTIPVQAINKSQTRTLIPGADASSANVVNEACIFCGVQNTPDSLDIKDFVAGFSYVDISQIRKQM